MLYSPQIRLYLPIQTNYTMKYVAYLRLSKLEKGKTIEESLGISAQRHDITRHIEREPGELLKEFIEIETGTNKRVRIEIYKAIEMCKANAAVLIVAKLDRLARNVSFISALMDSGIDFVCCDQPHANKMSLQVLSAVAEQEATFIANRIKSALNVKKERGDKLGAKLQKRVYLTDQGRMNSIKTRREQANLRPENRIATAFILKCKKNNETLQEIANQLNEMGLKTVNNSLFTPKTVQILLKRAKETNNNA